MKDYIFLFIILAIILIGLFNIRYVGRIIQGTGHFFRAIGRLFHRRNRNQSTHADSKKFST